MSTLVDRLNRLRARFPRTRIDAPSVIWAVLTVCVVALLEIAGARSRNDLEDVALLGAVGLYVLAVREVHRSRPLSWVTPLVTLGGVVRTWFGRFESRSGLNLRDDPPLPRTPFGWRPIVVPVMLLACASVGVAESLSAGFLRAGLGAVSTTLYLVVIAALWTALGVTWFGYALLVGAALGDARIRRAENAGQPLAHRPNGAWLSVVVLAAGIIAGLLGLRATLPLAGLVGCAVASGILLTARQAAGASIVWRPGRDGVLRSVPMPAFIAPQVALVALVPALLVLLACGDEALGGPGSAATMPVTAVLGRAAAWSACAGASVLTLRFAAFLDRARRDAIERAAPPRLHLAAPLTAPAAAAVAADGWSVTVAPQSAPRDAVHVDPSHQDASDLGVRDALVRRRRVVLRRLIRRGLRRVLRRAAHISYEQGSGFLIAPHLWFLGRLKRDEDETRRENRVGAFSQLLGPDWAAVIPGSARQHLLEVLRGIEIDVIFLEDGVGFSGLRRVLTVLYEVYDVHGGRRAIQERDFVAVPRLRVTIHAYGADNPYDSGDYPEPDYDGVSRVRMLHVYRDRGGEEARETATPPRERLPVLV